MLISELMLFISCFWCVINIRLMSGPLSLFFIIPFISCNAFSIPFTNLIILLYSSYPLNGSQLALKSGDLLINITLLKTCISFAVLFIIYYYLFYIIINNFITYYIVVIIHSFYFMYYLFNYFYFIIIFYYNILLIICYYIIQIFILLIIYYFLYIIIYIILLIIVSMLFSISLCGIINSCTSDLFECGFYSIITSTIKYKFNY